MESLFAYYNNNLGKYSYFTLSELTQLIEKKQINYDIIDDYLKIYSDFILYSYHFQKTFRKIDISNFKELYIEEQMVKKIFSNYSGENIYYDNYVYEVNKLFKGYRKSEINLGDNIEVQKENDYFVYRGKASLLDSFDVFENVSIFYHFKVIERKKVHSLSAFYNKLKEIKLLNTKPKLLLHSCCGPCSSYCLELLHDYFDVTILYYNPNIDSLDEYQKRLQTQKEIVNKLGFDDIKIIEDDYNHNDYLSCIKGLEYLGEKTQRCYECYKMRMARTCVYAKHHNFDFFTTTISISPHKVAMWLNEIGIELDNKLNMPYLYADFKQHGGYIRSIALSKKYDLYRQDYCGCEFSKQIKKPN